MSRFVVDDVEVTGKGINGSMEGDLVVDNGKVAG